MTPAPAGRRVLDGAVDLAVVLRGVALRWRDGFAWAARFPEGPATVVVRATARGLEAEAWGEGHGSALAAVPALIGLEDTTAAVFRPTDPVFGPLARAHPELRLGRTGQLLPSLVRAILGQRVTGRSAASAWLALLRQYGAPAPGPVEGLLLPPDVARLALEPYARLHPLGIDRRRAATVIALCGRARRLQALVERPSAEALTVLATLPGVGPWSLGHVAAEVWGDPDAVPLGDYHLPHHVAWVLRGRERSDDAEMLELLAPWAGHRARVLRLLQHVPGPPRRGPRGDDPDIRDL